MEKENQTDKAVALIRELIGQGATVDLRLNGTVTVVPLGLVVDVIWQDLVAALEDRVGDDNPTDDPVVVDPPKPDELRQMVVPVNYAAQDLSYNNEFRELVIDSLHGTGIGDPAHPFALYDAPKRWNVVALDGNSEKAIKACIPNITHDIDNNGIILRSAAYDDGAPIADWVKESYGKDPKATHGAMISTEGRQSFTVGVFQAMVKKVNLEEGDHGSLWLLSDDPRGDDVRVNYPPEEDLFEQVPGDSMGDGLSMNVHGVGDVFERFPDITLEDWTLMEIELTENQQIIFRVNGVEKKRTPNPYPHTPRYALFTFESNGNWPSAVGSRTKYKALGSEYQFAYWRIFKKS